jgi:hypothetical protein
MNPGACKEKATEDTEITEKERGEEGIQSLPSACFLLQFPS